MFSSVKRLTSTALALIFMASPAFAADITPDGATKLKTVIQTALDLRKNVQAASGGEYIMEGALKVEPADGYYAVTFPHIKIKDLSGKTYDIGMVAANVIPGATDTEWKAAIAMPTPTRIINADGTPNGQIDIGQQKAVGIWDTKLNSFVRLDATYNAVEYKDAANTLSTKIGTIAIKNQLSYEANGNISGPVSLSADDWVITSSTDATTAKMKSLRFDGSIKDYDPKIGESVQQQLGALGQTGYGIINAQKDMTPEHHIGLYNMISNLVTKSSDAFSTKISLTDFSLDTTNPETQKPDGFKLAYAGLGFSMSGFREGSVKTGLLVKYDGLEMQDKTDSEKDLLPHTLNLDLNINKLPLNQLVDLGRSTVEATGEAASMAGMQAMMTVPKLLTDAGTNLTHTFDLASPVYKSSGNGVVNADIKAVQGYTAEQSMTFEGLDKLIALINEEIKKPNNPDAQSLQSTLGTLTILQMVGQKDASNPDLRTYKLVVDQQGKSMLNGSDMSALIGGASGGMGGAGAPVPESAPQAVTPEPSGAQ